MARSALLALTLLLAACSEASNKAPAPIFDDSKLPVVEQTIAPTFSAAALQQVGAYNAMAVRLYLEAAKRKGNVFISPASIGAALGMAQAGAGPGSKGEFAALLGNKGGAAASAAQSELLKGTSFEARGRVLRVRSSLWLDQSTNLRPGFDAAMRKDWGAGIERADFKGDTAGARRAINAVAARDTFGRIDPLLGEDDLSPYTRLVLLNTVYFKAPWMSEFWVEATRPAPFHRADGSKAVLPMMNLTSYFHYLEMQQFQAISMPYKWGETEMIVFLPKLQKGLPALEAQLETKALAGWIAKLDTAQMDVQLKLPRFKIGDRLDIAPMLQSMGLKTAFDPFKADFTRLADASPERPLYLGRVIHQTELDVDERGTVAVAVAATELDAAAAAADEPPKQFTADHPFLFVIRDRRSGLLLFIGRFTGD